MSNITSETDLNTNIGLANGGTDTTGTFTVNVTENAAPTAITDMTGALTLDGANFTLTGDGTDAALSLSAAATVTIENLNIANTGAGAGIATSTGSTVTFATSETDSTETSTISAAITGAGAVVVDNMNAAASAVIFNAANTYTGATTVEGYLALGAHGSIANSASVDVVLGGTFDISGAQTSTGAATAVAVNQLTGGGDIFVGNNSLQVTDTTAGTAFGGVISDAAADITSTGGLTVQAGALTLTGANTYEGSTKVFGTLALGVGGSIEDSSNVSLKASGAKLDLTGANGLGAPVAVFINELTGVAGTAVKMGGNNLTVTETATATFSGAINGTGLLTVGGTAELFLAGANTYSGATIIGEDATLGVSGSGSLNTSGISGLGAFDIASATGAVTVNALNTSGDVTLGANKLILAGGDITSTAAGVISGTGAVQVGAAGDDNSLTVTAADTYTGSTVIDGALAVGVGGSIANTSNVSLKASGAMFSIADGTGPVAIHELTGVAGSQVVLGANSTLAVTETTAASFSGVISGSGGLTLSGPATLTLTGINTLYTGATTISSGADLALAGAGSIAGSALTDGGVFDISGVNSGMSVAGSILVGVTALDSLGALPPIAASAGSVVLGNNTLDIVGGVGSFAGVISGAGNLTIGGTETSGTETLTGVNTYTGTTTVTDTGTLNLGTLTVAGASISSSTNIVNNGTINVTNTTLAVSGTFSDTGESALNLTGAVLDISKASGPVTVAGDLMGHSGTVGGVTVGSSIVLGSNNLILAGDDHFTGAISGAGGVQVAAGGDVRLTGAETYTGSTVVTGRLDLHTAALASSNVSLQTGGTLEVNNIPAGTEMSVTTINELTGQTGTSVELFGANLLVNETIAATFSGMISGGENFTLGGTAVLTLAGDSAEAFTGTTTINAGASLAISGDGSIADSTLVDNGVFTVGAPTMVTDIQSVTALSGTGVVKMQTFGLTDTLTSTTTTSTFSGAIHGASMLTVAGASSTAGGSTHQTLSGTSDYSGGTTITGGTLELASAHAVGAGAITFADTNANVSNSVLQIDNAALTGAGTATESFANTIGALGANDIIDLSGLSFNTVAPPVLSSTVNNQLVVTEGGVSVTLALTGVVAGGAGNVSSYHVFEDSHGGTYITLGGTATTPDSTHFHP
jgi:fibronectin-binding autotransporter adhesin